METIRMEDVRREYPSPRKSGFQVAARGGYCVGGALVLFCRRMNPEVHHNPLPYSDYLAEVLRTVNPLLDKDTSTTYALNIILHNDREQFIAAWNLLDKALRHGQPPCPISESELELVGAV